MAIPYRTAKFKSANILEIAILDSTAKFNLHQYFYSYFNKMFIYLGGREEGVELQEFQEEGAGHLVVQGEGAEVQVHQGEGVGHLADQEEGAELQECLEVAVEHQASREEGAGHLVPLRTSWAGV